MFRVLFISFSLNFIGMNLRKRKSIEKQVEIFKYREKDTEDTAISSFTEKERALSNNFWDDKRVKVEETKTVLNETVKIEDEGAGLNDCEKNDSVWEEVGEKANKRVNTKVSDKFAFK